MKIRKISVTVAPEMTWLFGEALATTGGEDELLTISYAERHLANAARSGNVVIARAGEVFVDAISLIDEPQRRP